MSKKFASFLLTIVLVFTMIIPCFAAKKTENTENDFDTSLILVMIKKEYSEYGKEYTPADFDAELIESVHVMNQIDSADDTKGYDVEYWQQILSLYLKTPNKENVEKAITAAYKNPQVETAIRNYIYEIDCQDETNTIKKDLASESDSTKSANRIGNFPNDARLSNQGGLTFVRAQRAWSFATGSAAVKIGVLDTGIDSHPDLQCNPTISRNFTDEPGLDDNVGHGTHVAGIINATTDNLIGVAGVCWNASLVNLKVLKLNPDTGNGTGQVSWLINAIQYAAEKSIRVLNASLSYNNLSEDAIALLTRAIQNFDGILVCSAGNISSGDNISNTGWPTLVDSHKVISVAACDSMGNIASFSKYDREQTDIFANGVDILSTIDNLSYTTMSGTSMSAPFVTGAIGLLLGIDDELSTHFLRLLIIGYSDTRTTNINGESVEIYVLNVLKSVLAALGYCLGDVNMDKSVTAADARLALRYSASLETFTEQQMVMADVNYDNEITAADARIIQNYAAGLDSPL